MELSVWRQLATPYGLFRINHLTPEENQEAYKNWQYFKKNQSDLTEQWKTYWAKKLIESYEEKETEENEKSPETE